MFYLKIIIKNNSVNFFYAVLIFYGYVGHRHMGSSSVVEFCERVYEICRIRLLHMTVSHFVYVFML